MGDILNNSKTFFKSMSNDEFENLMKDMGLNFTKVEPGEGGILYEGKLYKTIEELDKASNFKWVFGNCLKCCYYDKDMYGAEGCKYANDYINVKDGFCNECKLKENI